MLLYTVGSIFYQVIFVPKIMRWVETAAIKADDGDSKLADKMEESLDKSEEERLFVDF
jgi:hypothetical protein